MESKDRLKQRSSNTKAVGNNNGDHLTIPTASGASAKTLRTRNSSKRGRSNNNSDFFSPVAVAALVLLVTVLASAGTYTYFSKVALLQHDAELRERFQQEQVAPLSKELHDRIEQLERESTAAKKELETAKADKAKILAEQSTQTAKVPKMKERLDKLVAYKKRMHQAIQHISKQRLLEKFGPGPHRVEVKVAYDPNSNIYGASDEQQHGGTMVLQLAPVDLMPHTVYWFLEQVDRGLYDGCSFHRNAGHVIQAGPAPNFQTQRHNLPKAFADAGYASVLFQEYAAEFPHKKYTAGFAGRPGGPDWYISMQDNSRAHGPGGQGSYEDAREADPCFAQVVEGQDVADHIHQSAVQPGNYKRMQHYVAIVSMRILKEEDGAVGVVEEHHDIPAGAEEE